MAQVTGAPYSLVYNGGCVTTPATSRASDRTLSILPAPPTEAPNIPNAHAHVQSTTAGSMSRQAVPRTRRWRILRATGATFLLVVVVTLTMFGWLWQRTPSTTNLAAWVRAQDAAHHAPYTPLTSVSPYMLHALVAIEDERFYQHHGLDTLALLRAAWDDARAGSLVEGGSTLTAQLAKNAYLGGHDHTVPLKMKDLVLALKVEQRYSKRQILELYLNLVYYGEGAYGIGAASVRYFGITPAHLDVAQAALLAGLVQAPGYYDPWCHPGLARMRQHAVFARMLADGYLTPSQAHAATAETFAFWVPGAPLPPNAFCPA